MGDQVIVFQRYFPYFKYQFINLRSIKFIRTDDILLDLPYSVSALTFQGCTYVSQLFVETIVKQAKSLTYLKIDCFHVLQSIDITFPSLTYLNIGHVGMKIFCCFLKNKGSSSNDYHLLIKNLRSPINHLKLSIENENLIDSNSIPNFDYLSHCLTNLTMTCLINKTFSFEYIQNYLMKLLNLKSLTIVIKLDLIDGKQWEEFIRKTKIIKFNFQFILSENVTFTQSKSKLLDSFRSTFWLKEKYWYVGCNKHRSNQNTQISVYSIPKFLPTCINYTRDRYPPSSTVPSNDEQRIFYSRYIEHLHLDFNKSIDDLPNYRFIHVNSLNLSGSTLPSIDNIISIVDLNQIKELNISHIKNISIGQIHLLLEHIPNLYHLIFKNLIPLFKPPSHIYSFTIEKWKFSDDLNLFCRMFSHVKSLKIDIISLEMMIELINRLKYLESILVWYNFEKHAPFISMNWLRRNIPCLRRKKFTCKEDDYYMIISIGNNRKKKCSQVFDQILM
ncbi:unnamed protein product [Rotaria sordida]|uniref:Uncharacterized protein n=1 Tax=Rotaria sordida TaxID=392033 RepID=A0A819TCJ3_9BILA|nr:unnamed protein product [Rotaria sordida]